MLGLKNQDLFESRYLFADKCSNHFEIGGPVAWFFSITGFITLKTQAAGSPIGTFGDDREEAIGI